MVYNFFHSDAYQLSRKSDLMYVVPTPYSVSKTILRAPYPYRIAANSLVLSSNGLSAIALVPYFIKLPGSCLKSKAIPKTVPELYSVLFKASTAFSVFSWLVFRTLLDCRGFSRYGTIKVSKLRKERAIWIT